MRRLVLALAFLAVGACARGQNPACKGIWISNAEISALPTSGSAWAAIKAAADRPWVQPNLSDQNQPENCYVLARALVYARTGEGAYRDSVIRSCIACIGTEAGGETLALGRELAAYVIAADLVGLPAADDVKFRDFLGKAQTETLAGKTLIGTHETKPNNWSTICGFTRIAIAAYLNDQADLARAAQVFRGWLGDRTAYAGFIFNQTNWQAWQSDPAHPRAINPRGATIAGHSVDGALPEELRRAGGFVWPPPKENYQYTGLEGAFGQAILLSRARDSDGDILWPDVWKWSDSALLRAWEWLQVEAQFPPSGNDLWMTWAVNFYYQKAYKTVAPAPISRAIAWTDWTLGPRTVTPPAPFTWTASFSPTASGWSVAVPNTINGIGATTADAVRDWLSKNPGKP